MSATSLIVNQLARIPDVGYVVGTFVRMDGQYAIVNIGPNTVPVAVSGFYPPAVGMFVQIERRNGVMIVTGPAQQLNPMGKIKAVGSPKATVTVDGKDYVLGMRDGYSPAVGDDVEINWATGIIQGKVTATATPEPPETVGSGTTAFSGMVVQAYDSGNFWSGRWNSNDPRASTNNRGAWFYRGALRDSLRGASNLSGEIYLPPLRLAGSVQMGLHSFAEKGGAPGGSSFATLPSASGWVPLPAGFAEWLRDNVGGVVVDSSNGDNRWRGRASDGYSGAMRFSGTR